MDAVRPYNSLRQRREGRAWNWRVEGNVLLGERTTHQYFGAQVLGDVSKEGHSVKNREVLAQRRHGGCGEDGDR